ncbi:nodulation protein NodZ [Tateyamaria armeniaca]|uniref:Nodulation protein NodZ n=1 Tax=Tateyamaria armeniaca TaxID=2518930 RepID=A0ABW8UN15_9RHOB
MPILQMTDAPQTYAVSKFTNSGFGDHLSCVFGTWWYARQTGRTLVIDWRGSRFNPTPGQNCFFAFFKEITSLGGVPVIADDRVAQMDLPLPVYPDKWTAQTLKGATHVPHTADEIRAMNALVAQTTPRPEPTVVINQHIHTIPAAAHMRPLLAELQFADKVSAAADAFCAQHWKGRTAIGVHIRHGNGENIGGRASYWLDPIPLLRQLRLNQQFDLHQRSAAGTARGKYHDNAAPSLTDTPHTSRTESRLYRDVAARITDLRGTPDFQDAVVFLCTDAKRVEEGLARHIDGICTYPKHMLQEGGGPLHQVSLAAESRTDGFAPVESDIVTEMLIELELLRRTRALVCIPSQFSVISRLELPAERQFFLTPSVRNRLISRMFDRFSRRRSA